MDTFIKVAVSTAALLTPLYLFAYFRWHRLLANERPDWLPQNASSVFYRNLPRAGDPEVTLRVLRLAFSGAENELQHPHAARYARQVRWGLSSTLGLYLVAFVAQLIGAP